MAGAGRKEAAALLRRWSAVAKELMAGRAAAGGADGPGHDTGIALDAGPSSLTVTFGFVLLAGALPGRPDLTRERGAPGHSDVSGGLPARSAAVRSTDSHAREQLIHR
ncbi:hypothetical protein SCALM49S_04757 [Streptomyces californicus]